MNTDTERHIPIDTQISRARDQAEIVEHLGLLYRQRQQVLRARTRLSNQVDAQERIQTGNTKGGKAAKNRFVTSPAARAAAEGVTPILAAHLKSLVESQKPYDKAIAARVEQLPIWTWAEPIRGAGALMLGLVIGAAGDLSNYSNPAKLWKRMGLAVMPDGTRQRKVAGEAAIEHGYAPERRSLMFNLGECLIKLNQDGPYRRLYDERKAIELARLPEDAKCRKAWAHNRASRYMQKRFLVDLWRAWRVEPVTL